LPDLAVKCESEVIVRFLGAVAQRLRITEDLTGSELDIAVLPVEAFAEKRAFFLHD
jgi:hypothetical protein